ncbi:distal membrane-arm assembly complex protein 2 [Musca vetustissima]|uniref:distal membrane-arm assembly complex protein 2 n=1 Tax=Musca vetustissima TaxID=27455 RepID=UPI002AB63C52|nr:distal membrane-arm assembly complex protein 2 [Musca vetustissima]
MLKLYKNALRQPAQRCLSLTACRHNEETTNNRESATLKRIREELAKEKAALKWRKTNEEMGDVTTKLKYFANNDQTSDFILLMQKPLELSPKKWMAMWEKKKEKDERHMQKFIPERHEILGPDLATAHFILHRGGLVKFVNAQHWTKADEDKNFKLPNKYDVNFKLEAIRCDNMRLYYEGLENIRWLQHLKFASFHNVLSFDDWCLDRFSGSQCANLEVLDISGTQCTARGLSCLYRLRNLKLLIVNDPQESLEYELTCSMLEETLPKLKIVNAASVHNLQ